MKERQRKGELKGRKVKDEVDSFFASTDDDGDFKVTFDEYKQLWVPRKGGKKGGAKASGGKGGSFFSFKPLIDWNAPIYPQLLDLIEGLPERAQAFAKESPYIAFSGFMMSSAAVYIGGQVARVW